MLFCLTIACISGVKGEGHSSSLFSKFHRHKPSGDTGSDAHMPSASLSGPGMDVSLPSAEVSGPSAGRPSPQETVVDWVNSF